MTAAEVASVRIADPVTRDRGALIARVVVLATAGLAVTFSATMHEQLWFDRVVVGLAFAALAVVHFATALRSRSRAKHGDWLLAGGALVAALALAVFDTPFTFAVTIAAWAFATALTEFFAASAARRKDARITAVLAMVLAVAAGFNVHDPVGAVGFFGAYAIAIGVFLGIAAFDFRDQQPEDQPVRRATAGAPATVTAPASQP